MKILHFSTWKSGGAAKAAERLSSVQREIGHDSRVVNMSSKLPAYLDAAVGKLTDDHNPIFHSYNYFPDNFAKIINSEKPDIVHLHWIGAGFVRPESLIRCPVPIVWTLHDLWPILGAEHLPPQTGLPMDKERMKDGYLRTNRPKSERGLDLNRYVWERKRRLMKNKTINFIAPSRYIYNEANNSNLISSKNIVQISNFVDTNIFKNKSEAPHDLTLFYPAMNADLDSNKGLDLLTAAINLLPSDTKSKLTLKIAGTNLIPPKLISTGIRIVCLGTISDDKKMAEYYQSSDVVVVPSRLENIPYTAMESLSCGTPVVAFDVGGIPELVIHNKTGYLAKPYDESDLVKGIASILNNHELRSVMSKNGVIHIKNNFSKSRIVEAHLKLYNSLLNR